ncbi:MAG: 16S rRNA (adenine(1518)-N(6)/adenine(1519)-N(6))-dimethyltransferase RsmA [Bacillota bacterium]
MDNLASKENIKKLMNKYNIRFSKSLGQNFLTDEFLIYEIINRSNLNKEDSIIEIGPGVGVLTKELAQNCKKIVAVEIDDKLIPLLNDTLGDFENIKIINDDILKVDLNKIINNEFDNKPKVVANLPYYITTPIIMRFLEEDIDVSEIIVMVQKEVAERMIAKPGNKTYGSLSVAVQYYTDPTIILDVPRDNFIPKPNVDSAVIRLNVKDKPKVDLLDDEFFFKIVKGAFALRRKTLPNSLSKSKINLEKDLIKEVLKDLGIDLRIRGEKLDINQLAKLSNELYKRLN